MSGAQEEPHSKGHTYLQWILSIIANSIILTYGLQSGWISPMAKILQSDQSPTGKPLSDIEFSWVASTPALAAVGGVVLFAIIVERCGRKMALIAITITQALCWIIKLIPSTTTTLIIARLCCGLAAGGAFSVVPMYVKEISQDDIRGATGFIMVVSQNIGTLVIFAVGPYLNYYTLLWCMVFVPIFSIVILLIMAPESPNYLAKCGKFQEAAAVIAKLRGLDNSDKEIQNEIDLIKREDEMFKSIPNISFLGILRVQTWRRGFIIMLAILFAQGYNGAYAVITYASPVLKTTGVSISPDIQALSIPLFTIISSVVSMNFVERLGRKPILAAMFILSALSFASLGLMLNAQQKGYAVPGWLPIIAIVIAVCCFAAGVLPLPYVILAEIFNFQIRTKLIACIVSIAWITGFLQLFMFNQITNFLGFHINFYLFAIVNLFGFFITLIALPETKCKNIEQIEEALKRK